MLLKRLLCVKGISLLVMKLTLVAAPARLASVLVSYHYSVGKAGTLIIQRTTSSYDKQDKPLKQSPSQTTIWAIDEANGHRLSITSPANNRISTDYDSLGRKIAIHYQSKGVAEQVQHLSYQWQQKGISVTIHYPQNIDGQYYTKTWQFDALGRQTVVTDEGGKRQLQTLTYNDMGKIAKQTDIDNQTQIFYYDAQGRKTQVIQANQVADITHYDDVADTISQYRQAVGQPSLYTAVKTQQLNDSQQVTSQWVVGTDNATSLSMHRYFDNFGNIVSEDNEHDARYRQQSRNSYNAFGQVTTSTLMAQTPKQKNLQLQLRYNIMGKLIGRHITDSQGNVHGYRVIYDAIGHRLAKQFALGNWQTYDYLPDKQQRQVHDLAGQEIDETYECLLGNEHQIKAVFPATPNYPRFTQRASYDPATGQLISRSFDNQVDQVNYHYQADGQLIRKTYVAKHKNIQYRYKMNGDLQEKIDVEGWQTRYNYDHFHHVTQLTWLDASGKRVYQVKQYYDALGQLTNKWVTNADDTVVRDICYQYNRQGQLIRVDTKQVNGDDVIHTYHYNKGGNIEQVTETLWNNGEQWRYRNQYQYDNADRLSEEIDAKIVGRVYQSTQIDYQYDANGNAIEKVKTKLLGGTNGINIIPEQQHDYRFNALDQLLSVDQQKSQIVYDTSGNIKQDNDKNQYFYNSKNQLMKYIAGNTGVTTKYQYYPSGLRKSQTQNGVSLTYYYDGQQLINSEDSKGNYTSYLLGTQREARILSNSKGKILQTDSYGYNQQGSVMSVTQDQKVNYHHYDSDGNDQGPIDVKLSLQRNPFKYSGEQQDANGLLYLRARYYKPNLLEKGQLGQGRFLSLDSYDKTNGYRYADDNPVMKTDPSGHSAQEGFRWFNVASSSLLLIASIAEPIVLANLTHSVSNIGLGVVSTSLLTCTANALQLISTGVFGTKHKLREQMAWAGFIIGLSADMLNLYNSWYINREIGKAQVLSSQPNTPSLSVKLEKKGMINRRASGMVEKVGEKFERLSLSDEQRLAAKRLWNPRVFSRYKNVPVNMDTRTTRYYFASVKWLFRGKKALYGANFVHLWVKASVADHLFNR